MIRTQLNSLNKIKDSLVLLDIPSESAFVLSTDKKEAGASVTVTTVDGQRLTNEEARQIVDIVVKASGASGMKPVNVNVTDQNLNIYNTDGQSDLGGNSASDRTSLETYTRGQLEEQVLKLLTPLFGPDKVRVSVNVRLNFDDVRSEAVEFSPPVDGHEEGMILSMSKLREYSRNDGWIGGIPGTDENGMGSVEYPYGENEDGLYYGKYLEEINYEMNKTTTQITQAKGYIEYLSIGVVVDETAVEADYTGDVTELVAEAIGLGGVDTNGDGITDYYDHITVKRLPFAETGADTTSLAGDVVAAQRELEAEARRSELIKTIVIGFLILLIALMILLMLRSIFKKTEPNYYTGENVDYLADEGIELDSTREYGEAEEIKAAGTAAGSITKLSENTPDTISELKKFIDNDPEAVVRLLRNWIGND